MNNKPNVKDFLAEEIRRLSLEKAYLQEALVEANAKIVELEEQLTKPKLTALSNEVKENLAQVKELGEHTKQNSETAQKSLLELTEQVFNLSADVEALKAGHEDETEEEHHETNSETSSTGTTSTPTDGTIASN